MSQVGFLFLLVVSLMFGCAQYDMGDSNELGRDKKANKEEISKKIINGSLDFSHANVVAVMSQTNSCTGTIIAPKVILTAAHCVIDGGRFLNPREVWVTNSFSDRAFEAAAITQYAVHPGWYTQEIPPHDVALLLLDRQLQTPAMPMFVANPLSLRGETIQAVGFGVTNGWTQTGGGQKRATTLVISDFFQGGFDATSPSGRQTDTCQGDSGGPAIVTMNGIEYVMGVVSSGPEGCIGLTHYSGLDDKAQWISGVLGQMNGAATPPAAPPQPPASNSGGGAGASNSRSERSTCPYVNDGECDEPTYCDVGTDTADCQNTQSSQSTPSSSSSSSGGQGQNSSNSCRWANDNVCDEPAYCLPGTDTADCQNTQSSQSTPSSTPPSTPPSSSSGGQGQSSANSCRWANDNVCDEPTYCLSGTDTADCQNTQSSQSTPSSSSSGQGQNGSNSCRYANDNECDEPYFCAVGTDTADCQAAANTTSSSSASSSSSGQPTASAGPNSCRWANDNMCDEPMNCAIGTDTADCQNSSATAASQGGFGNSCTYANDGECDEPFYCALGTDQNDCANQNTSSNPTSSSSSASSSSSGSSAQRCAFANDGECDEPYYCAVGTDGNDCQ